MEWITDRIGDLNEPLTANQLIVFYLIYQSIKITQLGFQVVVKMYKSIKKDIEEL